VISSALLSTTQVETLAAVFEHSENVAVNRGVQQRSFTDESAAMRWLKREG
jgi:hypothetical protein